MTETETIVEMLDTNSALTCLIPQEDILYTVA